MTATPITESRKREIAERCEIAMLTALVRISALETALREACNWIADRSPDGSMLVDRLRAVADAVESRET